MGVALGVVIVTEVGMGVAGIVFLVAILIRARH